ncbi:glycosyltransferase family 4 protein [Polaribacter porphyrae]|uniref:Glycosyl transferase family 1 n=1 Tax=Polaribacter porphyrae TaxID=1137780 RepID=A0A2S7WN72_9FLAO|nr:glycosyltransferase family 4 protein [Polaribacter porphyrae]PQJ79043.1 glycosyl transferase family 1 [Polaribacter porphyrae]
MRVLIITYYWPPAGGSGVQRWLKFAKYLRDFGVEPIIYTVENANYPKEDKSLLYEIPKGIEVLQQPIFEPTDLLFWKRKNNQKKDVSNAVNSSFLSFVRGNFFIPDPKIFWVKKSVKYLNTYLKHRKVDVVISTGPPHSMHLIAKKIAQKNQIKWLADFRDPWSNLYYNKELRPLSYAKKNNLVLEKSVLKNADCILTVSDTLKKEFSKNAKRVEVITNGFDDEVLQNRKVVLDNTFSISYIGLLPKQSNPKLFFKAVKRLCDENESFKNNIKLNFIGDISNDVKEDIYAYKLNNVTNFIGYVSHQKAIEYQKKAQVLLLLIPNVENSEGILTGKLFEYLTAKRPILALGKSKSDLSKILKDTNVGVVLNYDDEDKIYSEIKRLYHQYQKNELQVDSINIEQYHRKNLTQKLAELLKSLHS